MRWRLFNLGLACLALIGCGRSDKVATKTNPSTNTQPQFPITVEDSGSKEVDALVAKLVSPRPAPFPSGYTSSPIDTFYDAAMLGYEMPEVTNAIALLKEKGPVIFPKLIRHLYDDRYSYSDMGPMLTHWKNYSVGQVITDILCDGASWHGGYKARHAANGTVTFPPYFSDYLKAKGPDWAHWVAGKSELDIQMDFIDWCVAKEKAAGFSGGDEQWILQHYEEERDRMKIKYGAVSALTNSASPAH